MRYKVILYGINMTLSTLSVLTECCFIGSRSNHSKQAQIEHSLRDFKKGANFVHIV